MKTVLFEEGGREVCVSLTRTGPKHGGNLTGYTGDSRKKNGNNEEKYVWEHRI